MAEATSAAVPPAPPAKAGRPLPYAGLAVGIFLVFALLQAANPALFPDFCIQRIGADLALHGQTPYNVPLIRAKVAEQFPLEAEKKDDPDAFVNNCGYFLPPMAVLLHAPFTLMPLPIARFAWAILCTAAAFCITRIPTLFLADRGLRTNLIWGGLVPFVLIINFMALSIVQVGQTTVLAVGCIALGQWCFERNRPTLGVLLWAVPFIKPHVALPLIPLAWYLGGWKRAAALIGVVAGLNLIGATIIDSPMVIRDYVSYLGAGHKTVVYNLVERNAAITSWNRLLFAGTGVLIEQTVTITLAGYLIWFGLVLARCAWAGVLPAASWAMAAAIVASVWCPQVLAYESYGLVLIVPWLRELFASGSRRNRVFGIAAALLLIVELLPFPAAAALGITFHRPLSVALLAVVILTGPIRPR